NHPTTTDISTLSLHDALPICPVERALAFRRKALKPRAALHQHDAKHFLKLLEAGRHGRLGNAAGFGGAPEVPLFCQRQQKFKLRSEEHTSELQSRFDLVCRLL